MRTFCWAAVIVALACGERPVAVNDGGVGELTDAGRLDAGAATDAGTSDGGSGAVDAGPTLGAPGDLTRTIAAFSDRLYDVHVPTGYDGRTPLPVVLALHGGGGNREVTKKTTCPGGNLASPKCLDRVADLKGFIIVYPDGTGGPLGKFKTWNAGGGDGGWQCISGYACNEGIDEKAYFIALLADLATVVRFDARRVFATGHSNGAAMSEALACQLPRAIAGIASVAGGNQHSTVAACPAANPVLEIHGTDDPCWLFDGGDQSCADSNPGSKISVASTIAGWLGRNGCGSTRVTTPMPDTSADGTTTRRHVYDCPVGHEVELLEVVGGGHTWPGGSAGGSTGVTSTDFSANEVILDFFAAH